MCDPKSIHHECRNKPKKIHTRLPGSRAFNTGKAERNIHDEAEGRSQDERGSRFNKQPVWTRAGQRNLVKISFLDKGKLYQVLNVTVHMKRRARPRGESLGLIVAKV
jgi:hypothetical protein